MSQHSTGTVNSGVVTPSSSSSQVLFCTTSCSVSTLATAWQRKDKAEKNNHLIAEVVTTEHAGKHTGDKTEKQLPKSSMQVCDLSEVPPGG